MVLVKGGFQVGRHGAALIETNCGFRFEAGSQSWPTALSIALPSEESHTDPPVQYTLDRTAENLLRLLVSFARSEENRERIIVTIEGELRVGKAFRAVSSNDGYGPFGMYPGELVMKTIRHVEISVAPKGKE